MKKNTKLLMTLVALVAMGAPMFAGAFMLTRQLEVGSSGADVTAVQTFLAGDASLYPEGLVTGYFGTLTEAAVKRFQTRNGISAVGRIGPITLPVINSQMNSGSTVGFDKTQPFIYSVNVSTANNEATITWNTSENAAAIIYYATSELSLTEASANSSVYISGTAFLAHTDLRTAHIATLTGLQRNTTYHYVVYVRDGSGNERITWPQTFTTN